MKPAQFYAITAVFFLIIMADLAATGYQMSEKARLVEENQQLNEAVQYLGGYCKKFDEGLCLPYLETQE